MNRYLAKYLYDDIYAYICRDGHMLFKYLH